LPVSADAAMAGPSYPSGLSVQSVPRGGIMAYTNAAILLRFGGLLSGFSRNYE
jgi:hypothetical protein